MGLVSSVILGYVVRKYFGPQLEGVINQVKKAALLVFLWFQSCFTKRRLDIYDLKNFSDPRHLGVIPFEQEWQLEQPLHDSWFDLETDSILIYGANDDEEKLFLKIARYDDNVADAWLQYESADGRKFSLPEGPGLDCSSERKFSVRGLRLQCLEPLRRWRIAFNGLVRRMDSEDEDEGIYLKFNFLWVAITDVYDTTSDIPNNLVAEGLCSGPWSSIFKNVSRLKETLNTHEQAGQISGTITVNNEEEKEVYLWGFKVREFTPVSATDELTDEKKEEKGFHIFGRTFRGEYFHVAQLNLPSVSPKFQHGIYFRTSGVKYPFGELAFKESSPSSKEDVNDTAIKEFEGFSDRHCSLQIQNRVPFCKLISSSGSFSSGVQFINLTLNSWKGHGLCIQSKRGEGTKVPDTVTYLLPTGEIPEKVPLVCSFDEELCKEPSVSGGKGSSLAILTQIALVKPKFQVPKGIVATAEAYLEFSKARNIVHAVNALENVAFGRTEGDLKATCENVSGVVERSDLPGSVRNAIVRRMQGTFGKHWDQQKFAVRSSASGEDSEEMSAAGQMKTFLGVRGEKEIFNAVLQCWASQFSFTAVEYKKRYGQEINSPMAVVIQEMVPAEAAGVLFTCDPLTANPGKVVITANYGLGESVVSASADPDTIVISRDLKNRLAVEEVKIGRKRQQYVMQESGGVISKENENNSTEKCITNDKCLQLADIAVMVEQFFGTPRDMEWAFSNGDVYLLQARPVTSLDKETDFEIIHELDSGLRNERDCLTTANVGEVMCGSLSPLGSTVIKATSDFRSLYKSREVSENFPASVYYRSGMILHRTHMVFNAIDGLFRVDPEQEKESSKGNLIAFFGRVLENKELFTMAKERYSCEKARPTLKSFAMFFYKMFASERRLRHTRKLYQDAEIKLKEHSTSQEIFSRIGSHFKTGLQPFMRHMETSMASSVYNQFLLSTLAQIFEGWNSEVFSSFAQLTSNCTAVESADVPAAIQELGMCITACVDPEKFSKLTPEEALHWLLTTRSPAADKFSLFLMNHGHRCLKEFDVYSKPWGEDPIPLVKNLQMIVLSSEKESPKKDLSADELLGSLNLELSRKQRMKMKLLLPRVRNAIRVREASKSFLIKSYDVFRKAFRILADRMVWEGRLPEAELLYFLTFSDIYELLKTRDPRIISKAYGRKRLYSELDREILPEINFGPIKVLSRDSMDLPTGSTFEMKGTPVSRGVAKGTARVIIHLEEANSIQKGDILITHSTDIGWSPYFPLLSGVVTELGGLISHGAVVAREYGLPCVVGLDGATFAFKTGDQVLLDGSKGILKKLES